MTTPTLFRRLAFGLLLAVASVGLVARAAVAPAPEPASYSQAELDQVLAPIALYPDNVLADILMAATYPLEVVQAARWSRANSEVGGEEAVRAVQEMDWDPSVKALVAFPQVLRMMDERLDWTQRLGEAFLGDADRAMDAVQRLRRAAEDQGNLASSDELAVRHEGEEILIDSPEPDVVYVPYYDSRVVYGDWWWPDYPPVYWSPWPGYYYAPGYAFGWSLGIPVGFDFFYGRFDWGRHRVWTHDRRPFYVHGDRPWRSHEWRHDPRHRQGVAYNNPLLRERFGDGWRQRDGSRGPRPAPRSDSIARPSVRGDSIARPSVRGDSVARPSVRGDSLARPQPRTQPQTQPQTQQGFFAPQPAPRLATPSTPAYRAPSGSTNMPQVARPGVQQLERAPAPQVARPGVAQPNAPQYARPVMPSAPLARQQVGPAPLARQQVGPAPHVQAAPQVHAAPQVQRMQPASPIARSAPPAVHAAPQAQVAPSAPAPQAPGVVRQER